MVWHLIVLIPDRCILPFLTKSAFQAAGIPENYRNLSLSVIMLRDTVSKSLQNIYILFSVKGFQRKENVRIPSTS